MEKGLEPTKVLPRTLIPLLENASLEEDAEIQTKWAILLANAARPDIGFTIKPSYIEILKQLSPVEVKLLDYIYYKLIDLEEDRKVKTDFLKDEILDTIGQSYQSEYYLIIDNLYRLNLLQPTASGEGMTILVSEKSSDVDVALKTSLIVSITYLGLAFVKACNEI